MLLESILSLLPSKRRAQERLRLQKINEEVYKRNAELAVRNKTLSLLRQLYEITTLTLETKDLAHRLLERIRTVLNFKFVAILVVEENTKYLVPFVASFSQKTGEKIIPIQKEYEKITIPLSSKTDIFAKVLHTRQRIQTEKISDILSPFLVESMILEFQKSSRIQMGLVYPLLTESKELGILVFALSRKAKDLTSFERESIVNIVNVVAVALDRVMLYEALRNLTKELETANQELKRLDKAKSEFVSIASHQLRTPLTAMKGYLSLLLEGTYGALNDTFKKPINNIYNSNQRLIRLVNDLLSLSRIESGKIKADREQANVAEIVQSVIEELRIKAEQKSLKLVFDEPTIPVSAIFIDTEKIRNVILNLIDNSIRYTKEGSITTSITSMEKIVRITITDTGEGMNEEEIQKLFKSFSRGQAGEELSTEGAGLGLYIARKFVEMHKGKIWATSEGKEKGSTFHIELPVR